MTDLISERTASKKEVARFYPTLSAAPSVRHLNQKELARRWSMSPKTLERWRWLEEGPPYLKIGGKILYRLEDIEKFEAHGFKKPKNQRHAGRSI